MNKLDNIKILIERGSATARGGFKNEDDVVTKFNKWKTDLDARNWLDIMDYILDDIEKIEAIKIHGYKTDVQVKIKIYMKNALAIENISIKLVSNPVGFNQIDKRWVDKYAEMWAIPNSLVKLLKLFTGEIKPNGSSRDPRRMFIDEMTEQNQREIVDFFEGNKIMIITDLLKGRDKLAASWMLIYQKHNNLWSFLPISVVMNYYAEGKVAVTNQGSLRIGRITMQRKGGDQGRNTANMLQFKINPCSIVSHL